MPVSETELRRPALDQSSCTKFHHQVTDGKALADIIFSIEFTSRVQGNPSVGDDSGCKRDVGGNYQVVRC